MYFSLRAFGLLLMPVAAMGLHILLTAPYISNTHVTFGGKLTDILVSDGHFVHFFVFGIRKIEMLGTKNASLLTKYEAQFVRDGREPFIATGTTFSNTSDYIYNQRAQRQHGLDMATICQEVMDDRELLSRLKNVNYDVGIAHQYDACSFGIFKLLGIKTLLMYTPMSVDLLDEYELGLPIKTSYSNYVINGWMNAPNQTFWQRLRGVFHDHMIPSVMDNVRGPTERFLQQNFDIDVSAAALMREVAVIFTNSHELIETPRPTSHKLVHIGGIALAAENRRKVPIPLDVQMAIDSAVDGVVVVAFGSQLALNKLPRDMRLNIFNAFAHFPTYNFLIRYEVNSSGEQDVIFNYPNIFAFDWLPQRELFEHPKTKLFVTHGGRNSMKELCYAGVPALAVPLFSDQHYNAAMLAHRGIGFGLDLEEMREDVLVQALAKLLYDDSYRRNARELRDKLTAFPWQPKERFLKWVRYAATFGKFPEMNIPGANMSFIRVNNIDVYAFLILASLAFVSVLCLAGGRLISRAEFAIMSKNCKKCE